MADSRTLNFAIAYVAVCEAGKFDFSPYLC